MRDDYAQIVADICTERWNHHDTPQDEIDGGLGVAMVLAHLNGVKANLNDLATFLRVPIFMLDIPYKRLQMNGVFSPRSPILNDPLLKGESTGSYHRAWCHIAGLSSGFIGRSFTRFENSSRSNPK